jgi:CRP-like cAMP-binding protein
VLTRIPETVLDGWLQEGELAHFADGQHLIRAGEAEASVFLLLSGWVKVFAYADRRSTLLAVRTGGDLVGEIAALDGGARSATVTAHGRQPVITCRLAAGTFTAVLEQDRQASDVVTRSVMAKWRASTRRRGDRTRQTYRRLAAVLADLVEDFGQRVPGPSYLIPVELTQGELGGLIGVAEATAHRAMRILRKHGLVEVTGRRLIIRDPAELRTVAAQGIPGETGK